jgi:hypothetical protein
MSHFPNDDELAAAIAGINELEIDQLRRRYVELRGANLPKFMRRQMIIVAVAHAIREKALGGLDRETQKKLDQLVSQIVPNGERPPQVRNRKIKAGTRLLREWQGRVHEVTAVRDGFLWNGEPHRSLSHIARQITGTRWNGWLFFGVHGLQASKRTTVRKPSAQTTLPNRSAQPNATRGRRRVSHG